LTSYSGGLGLESLALSRWGGTLWLLDRCSLGAIGAGRGELAILSKI